MLRWDSNNGIREIETKAKKEKDTFTPAQGEVYDIFTEVASFVKWVDATALSMGGLQACEFLEKYHHCTTSCGPQHTQKV